MAEDRYQRINLRIPRELHAQLMVAAGRRSHSMNAEIVARLENSFRDRTVDAAVIAEMFQSLVAEAVEKIIAERKGTP